MHQMQWQLQGIANLQRHMVPKVLPQPMGWTIAVSYSVGSWPGGDYYDVRRLADGRLALLVADASGHGGLAAVLVAMVHVVTHGCPLASGVERQPFCPFQDPLVQPPHIILSHLNNVLVENTLDDQFMTAFTGVLSPADGSLHYASAGHPPPRWWRASTQTVEGIPDVSGFPLGLMANVSYHHKRIALLPGDILVIYSDGLSEAHNPQGKQFGRDRLDRAIQEAAGTGAQMVCSTILNNLTQFLAGAEPHDDVTLLVVQRQP